MQKKQGILIGCLALVGLLLAFFYPSSTIDAMLDSGQSSELSEEAIIPQEVVETFNEEQVIYTVYYKDRQLGIISELTKLENFLDEVNQEQYQ